MHGFTKKARPAAVALALAAAGPAQAAAGWYAGIGFGTTSLDDLDSASGGDLQGALEDEGFTATIDGFSTDDSDTGWRVFGGFRFNDYVAIEGFWTDLGSFDTSFSGSVDDGGEGGPVSLGGSVGVEAQGYGLFGVLSYPVGAGFSVLGKAGGIHWDADVPVAIVIDGAGASTSFGDDGTDFAWGGGLRYQVTDHIAVDAQYESFDVFGTDIEMLSGNFTWMF
jgi:OOP family OmpA-OmpF porin